MVSSHILPELADMCNKVGIIDKGVMDVNDTVAEVLRRVRERIRPAHRPSPATQTPPPSCWSKATSSNRSPSPTTSSRVTLKKGIEDYTDLSPLLIQAGHKIKLFREEEINLESAFMALTKGLGQRV